MTRLCWILSAALTFVLCNGYPMEMWSYYNTHSSIELLRRYIQIETIANVSDLQYAVNFWEELAAELDVEMNVYEYTEGFPVVVLKFPGTDPLLPSIMMNSHMDTVTFEESEWTYPPFSAHLDENGTIWGRGTQDMKSVSIQHYEALRRIKENDITLLRDVYITLMPGRPMAPIDEARRILSRVEFARAAADTATAQALNLIGQHIGRGVDILLRYLNGRPMAPIDEARRILSRVEFARAAADTATAQALNLIGQHIGRGVDILLRYLNDEELGGQNGMVKFVQSQEFIDMNVGFEMDESGPLPAPYFAMLHHDKAVWQIEVTCTGTGGHGSSLPAKNVSAIGQCINFMDLMYDYREEQYQISVTQFTDPGDYTSVNMNRVQGGIANNVLPSHVTMMFDMRLGFDVNMTEFEQMLESFAKQSGNGVEIRYILKNQHSPGTVVNATNPYYAAITEAAQNLNITITPVIASGATDGRYVRKMGIPALGFSPLANTESLLHLPNERINATTFLEGIDIYEEIVTRLGNIPAEETAGDSTMFLIGTPKEVNSA